MPITKTTEILKDASRKKYGVAAVNVFDLVSMKAILTAAEKAASPVIIQISVKTLKYWDIDVITANFQKLAQDIAVPAALHLDHCPDPNLAKACIAAGWNSVLFDGSSYSFEDNFTITRNICGVAHAAGAAVEGELLPIGKVSDTTDAAAEEELLSIEKVASFIGETGIDFYAPAAGTAHGMYAKAPTIRYDRVGKLAHETGIPMVLHGGTGLEDEVFKKLIELGISKINLSTALKRWYADSFADYLRDHGDEYDPLKLIDHVVHEIEDSITRYFDVFQSRGRA